jgi:hypothetical protein
MADGQAGKTFRNYYSIDAIYLPYVEVHNNYVTYLL